MGEDITVSDFLEKNSQKIDLTVAPKFSFQKDYLPTNSYSDIRSEYRRYGYGISSYMSKKLVKDWFADYSSDLSSGKFTSFLLNSGMSAIDLAIHSSCKSKKKRIIISRKAYASTRKLVDSYIDIFFSEINYFDSMDELEKLLECSDNNNILLIELGNYRQLPFLIDEEMILKFSKKTGTVIIDGTLMGLPKVDPHILLNENIIYVESLSKVYHSDESSKVTAGIIIASDKFTDIFSTRSSLCGSYLQLNDLGIMPLELYSVSKKRVLSISKNAVSLFDSLNHKEFSDKIGLDILENDVRRVPLVFFIRFPSNQDLRIFMKKTSFETRTSFGHSATYLLPLGILYDDAPEGLLRLSIGITKNFEKIEEELRELFGDDE